MGLRVALVLGIGGFALAAGPGLAQSIVPDTTLGVSSSVIRQEGTTDFIEGGLESDINLFHSFEEFGIAPGRAATFVSKNRAIENIFSRVTGNQRSEIFGVLGTVGFFDGQFVPADVNLFFINPNGILFGPSSRLNVGTAIQGSFFSTTLDGLVWPDGERFEGVEPQGVSPLLNIVGDPSGFIASQRQIPGIEMRSQLFAGQPGQSLILLGGNVVVDGATMGILPQKGGPLTLGGLVEVGTVRLEEKENAWRLGFPVEVRRGDVRVLGNSLVTVVSNKLGELAVYGRDVDIVEGSQLGAGIVADGGDVEAEAGNISIDAQEKVKVTGDIFNTVDVNGRGTGGDIEIKSESLIVRDGSQIIANTYGEGDAGSIFIRTQDRSLFQGSIATKNDQFSSAAFSRVEAGARGKGGNVEISSGSLEVLDGAQLQALTNGEGDAGNVLIFARDSVLFRGETSDGKSASVAFSTVESEGKGQGGNVVIRTKDLTVLDGAQLSSSTEGQGDAGNVILGISNRTLFNNSVASSRVEKSGKGRGGRVEISTDSLVVREGGQLSASTEGQGDAGNVTIAARSRIIFQGINVDGEVSGAFSEVKKLARGDGGSITINSKNLEVLDGARLTASSFGLGNAGDILIKTRDTVVFQGVNEDQSSTALSKIEPGATGQGGNIEIKTVSLEVLDGAQLSASTEGVGNAGDVLITAEGSVLFQGTSPDGMLNSVAFSRVESGAIGQGGSVEIDADRLAIRDGAGLTARTVGEGDAGNVLVRVRDAILIDGFEPINGRSSAIFTSNGNLNGTISSGAGGHISLVAPQLVVSDGAVIDSRTVNEKSGGNIALNLGVLKLASGGQILTTSDDTGPAGTLVLDAEDSIRISGTDVSYAARAAEFGAVVAPVTESSGIYLRSNGEGAAGNLILSSPRLYLGDNGQVIADSDAATGGNLILQLNQALVLDDNGLLSATAGSNRGAGDGGNINITTPFLLSFPTRNSDIIANAFEGTGGNITINADAILNFQLQDEPNVEILRNNQTNDISASSALGNSGILNLAGLNADPAQGSTQLPTAPTPPSQVDRTCAAQTTSANSFVATGRGGIPISPSELPTSPQTQSTWLSLDAAGETNSASMPSSQPYRFRPTSQALLEASQWQRDGQGNVRLIAGTTFPVTESTCLSHNR